LINKDYWKDLKMESYTEKQTKDRQTRTDIERQTERTTKRRLEKQTDTQWLIDIRLSDRKRWKAIQRDNQQIDT